MRVGRGTDRTAGQILFRARLFFSAYALLFFLFAIRCDVLGAQLVFFGLGSFGVLTAVLLIARHATQAAGYRYRVSSVEDAGSAVSGFLASHLLPFLAPGTPTVRDVVSYGVFFTVLLVVSVNSDLAHVNPILYLLGRRVVRISTDGVSRILVCSTVPKAGDQIRAVRATGGLVETTGGGGAGWRSSTGPE